MDYFEPLCYFKKGNDSKPYIHYPNWKCLLPPSGDVLSLGFIPYLFDSYKAMRAMHDSKWVLHAGVSEDFRWAGDSTVSSADISCKLEEKEKPVGCFLVGKLTNMKGFPCLQEKYESAFIVHLLLLC